MARARLLTGARISAGRKGRTPSLRAIRIARVVAIAADALQLVLFPLFAGGFGSALNDALDLVVCVAMLALIGWSPLFLPTVVVEILPFGNLAPTWTIAVYLVTRSRHTASRVDTAFTCTSSRSRSVPKERGPRS